MSDQEEIQRAPAFDRVLWLKWVLVSTLGWLIAWAAIGDVAVGLLMGVGQWLVLQSRVRQAGWWVLSTTLGWLAGSAVLFFVLPSDALVLTGATLGATTGIAQWLLLRRWARRQTEWWIVTSTLGWAVSPMLGPALVGAVVGAVTGFTLELLLRHLRLEAKPRPSIQP